MMQQINSEFATWINKTRNRKGYVYFDRFKSIPTQDTDYIRNLILYIHANPVRGCLVPTMVSLDRSKLTSHQILIDGINPYSWLNTDFMAAQFCCGFGDTMMRYYEALGKYTGMC